MTQAKQLRQADPKARRLNREKHLFIFYVTVEAEAASLGQVGSSDLKVHTEIHAGGASAPFTPGFQHGCSTRCPFPTLHTKKKSQGEL